LPLTSPGLSNCVYMCVMKKKQNVLVSINIVMTKSSIINTTIYKAK
jgi:hypothetical protein